MMSRRGVRDGQGLPGSSGVGAWIAFWESGVDPIVAGLVIGLMTCAYRPSRGAWSRPPTRSGCSASSPPRGSRPRPARWVRSAISPNERLQERYRLWTSYLIVPLFALANADIKISGSLPRGRVHLPRDARHHGRLHRRQARRHRRAQAWLVSKAGQAPADAAGRLGRGPWGSAPSPASGSPLALLVSSLAFTGTPAGRGQARHPVRRDLRDAAHLGGLRRAEPASRRGPGCGRCSAPRRRSPTWRCRSTRTATTSAARRRTRSSPSSSTATSSARTAGRPSPRSAASSASSASCASCSRHLPLTDVHQHAAARRRGVGGRGRAGRLLGDARHADGPPGRADLP